MDFSDIQISARNVISNDYQLITVPVGGSVHDILVASGVPSFSGLHIFLDDILLKPEQYKIVYPVDGQKIFIAIVPQGGDSGKDIMRSFAMIAISAAALAVSGGALSPLLSGVPGVWGGLLPGVSPILLGAGVGMVGSLLVNALIPPAVPDNPKAIEEGSQSYAITGTRNRMLPFDYVPKTLGRDLVYPPHAALPWTETKGNKQWVHMLFSLGQGRIEWQDPKFGETYVNLEDNQIEHGTGLHLPTHFNGFTNTPQEVNIQLDKDETNSSRRGKDPTIQTTKDNCIGVGLEFYSGSLNYFDTDFRWVEVGLEVLYRIHGEDDFSWKKPVVSSELAPKLNKEFYFDDNTIGKGNKIYLKGYPNTTSRWGVDFFINPGNQQGEKYDISIRRFWLHIKDTTFNEYPPDENNELPTDASLLYEWSKDEEGNNIEYWSKEYVKFSANPYYTNILPNWIFTGADRFFQYDNPIVVLGDPVFFEVRVWARCYEYETKAIGIEIYDPVNGDQTYPVISLENGNTIVTATGYETNAIDNGDRWYECVVRKQIPASGYPNAIKIHLCDSAGNTSYSINDYRNEVHLSVALVVAKQTFTLDQNLDKPIFEGANISDVREYKNSHSEDTGGINFDNLRDDITWTVLKTLTRESLNIPDDMNLLSVTALGTDKLSGVPDNFNVVVQGHHPVYQNTFLMDHHFHTQYSKSGFTETVEFVDPADNNVQFYLSAIPEYKPTFVTIKTDPSLYILDADGIPVKGPDGRWAYTEGVADFRFGVRNNSVNFDGNLATKVFIRLRQMGGVVPYEIKFQWKTKTYAYGLGGCSISLYVDSIWRWNTFELDLSSTDVWMNEKVKGVRLFFTHQLYGEYYDVDYFRIQYDDNMGWTLGPTSRPPWLFAEVHSGTSNHRAKSLDTLNGSDLHDWAVFCEEENHDYQYNATVSGRSVNEMKRVICAAGRATPSIESDSSYSVIIDKEQTIARQVFSPRNSWGFRASKSFEPLPHALRVNFRNVFKNYAMDEAIVYNDLPVDHPDYVIDTNTKYDETNATEFETTEYDGIVDPFHIWKLARQDFASAKLQPERFSLYVDPEYLVAKRGHLVRVQEDTVLWGQMSGRITNFSINGLDLYIELDEEILFEEGVTYAITVRTDDGLDPVTTTVDNHGGGAFTYVTATLAWVGQFDSIKVDNLVVFGVYEKTNLHYEELLITGIQPKSDYTAKLHLIHYAPEIYDWNTIVGTIPDFNANITEPIDRTSIPPNIPSIKEIISDERVMERNGDILISKMVIFLDYNANQNTITANQIEVWYRRTGLGYDWDKEVYRGDIWNIVISNVEEGFEYEVQIRAISVYGKESKWAYSKHTVEGKNAPPPTVQEFTITRVIGDYRLSWEHFNVKNKDIDVLIDEFYVPDFLEYELRYMDVESTEFNWDQAYSLNNLKGDNTTYRTKNNFYKDTIQSDWRGVRTFGIKAIDKSGNFSVEPATAAMTINPMSIAEGSFIINVFNNTVMMSWEINQPVGSLPFDYCLVGREGEEKQKKGNFTSISELYPGTYTYCVYPVDVAGNIGIGECKTVEVKAPAGYDSVVVNEQRFFENDPTNIESNNVGIGSDGVAIAPMFVDKSFQAHYAEYNHNNMQDSVNAGNKYFVEPVPNNAYYREVFYYPDKFDIPVIATVQGDVKKYNGGCTVSIKVEYRKTGSDEWIDIGNNVISDFNYIRVTYTFVNPDNDMRKFNSIKGYSLILSSEPIEDFGEAEVTDAANGVQVVFNKVFRDITSIECTYTGDNGYIAVPKYEDPDSRIDTGFTGFIFSDPTTKTTGRFYWRAKGY